MAKKKEGKSFLRRKYFDFSKVQIIILNLLSLLPTTKKPWFDEIF